MRLVQRSEVVDYETYNDRRDAFRVEIMAQKEPRRIHLDNCFTFLFENHDTMLYQIQEMIRAERIVRESDILHEIETYNELLGGPGELGCTLLIEIDSQEERTVKLSAWLDLPNHIYVKLEDGSRAPATFDTRQMGEDRLSSVQYIKFDTGGRTPVAIGIDFPGFSGEAALTEAQRQALAEDLAS